jgi:glucose-6-phosphate isomerase
MDRNTLILVLIAALVLLAVVSEALKAFDRAERQLDEESKKKAEKEKTEETDSDS